MAPAHFKLSKSHKSRAVRMVDGWKNVQMDSGRQWVVENETVKCFYYIFPPSGRWSYS